MENEFFLNAGISPSLVHFESNPAMPTWQQLSSAMEIQVAEHNCSSEQSPDCFLNSNWEKSVADQSFHFDSALSSMVSSPAASNSNPSNESFVIRELIGKLGSFGNSQRISQHSQQLLGNAAIQTNSYTTPLNSPSKLNFLRSDRLVKENIPSLCKSMALNSSVAEFSADPGFAERAARLSCFGNRSFNSRSSQLAPNGNEFVNYRSNPSIVNEKLSRVSSSPSLKALGSEMGLQENKNSSPSLERNELANSQDESTLSEQNPNAEKGLKASTDSNPRKRKSISKGKVKEPSSSSPSIATRVAEVNDKSSPKRCKAAETNGNEKASVKTEEDSKKTNGCSGEEKQTKTNLKPPEPPKDYIHVRARRGQATDSHSLAERVRREKISERMKLLQDLVPGCNKVTGKALMLDEIINYVQSLQHQVEFLSMKLASVNTRVDFNMDSLISKEMYQSGNPLTHPQLSPIDSSASSFYGGQQPQQNAALPSSSYGTARATPHCSVDPLDSVLCQNLGIQVPSLNAYSENGSQFATFGEDDLQTIVQMGFVQNQNQELSLQSQSFNSGSDQVSLMKIEL